MGWLSLILMAVALSTDAFAVAIVAGLALNPVQGRQVFRLSFHFGLFQALMPMLGWAAGTAVRSYIADFDHWVAFGLLVIVGGRMAIGAAFGGESAEAPLDPTRGWHLVLLSVATSVDALAVGLTLAMISTTIVLPAIVIGFVTAGLTSLGMLLGRRVGVLWGRRVEVAGGLVLIAIGVKIVIEHVGL